MPVPAVTVNVVVAEMAPEAALMVVAPTDSAEARPDLVPIVATEALEDVQVTDVVMSFMEPSE
jgi:hypothetical protein